MTDDEMDRELNSETPSNPALEFFALVLAFGVILCFVGILVLALSGCATTASMKTIGAPREPGPVVINAGGNAQPSQPQTSAALKLHPATIEVRKVSGVPANAGQIIQYIDAAERSEVFGLDKDGKFHTNVWTKDIPTWRAFANGTWYDLVRARCYDADDGQGFRFVVTLPAPVPEGGGN